ncbi:MAG: recombination regulator RecX [Gammaproteobacteria bacterium]|nr:recombination regulator RecX [Gammaproteobacteria bacterium]MDH5651362.1 recombination regulator RecX [Gammaproteobacteria bacterium]
MKEVRSSALDLLARREHSSRELTDKLVAKGYDRSEIAPALQALSREGLLSDERFAEAFVSSRLQRGSGPQRINQELQQRGINTELIDACLDERDEVWFRSARQVREKKFGRQLPTDFQERARQMRFLQYRGFTMAQIRHAVGEEEFEI